MISHPPPAPRMLVQLTEAELVELIEAAVSRALPVAESSPSYRDRAGEAQRLGVSVATLDRLCREGLPYVLVGDSRRFRAAEVDEWLDIRTQESRR